MRVETCCAAWVMTCACSGARVLSASTPSPTLATITIAPCRARARRAAGGVARALPPRAPVAPPAPLRFGSRDVRVPRSGDLDHGGHHPGAEGEGGDGLGAAHADD